MHCWECPEEVIGWGARDRTWEWRYQKPLPYRLATPQQAAGTIAFSSEEKRDKCIVPECFPLFLTCIDGLTAVSRANDRRIDRTCSQQDLKQGIRQQENHH